MTRELVIGGSCLALGLVFGFQLAPREHTSPVKKAVAPPQAPAPVAATPAEKTPPAAELATPSKPTPAPTPATPVAAADPALEKQVAALTAERDALKAAVATANAARDEALEKLKGAGVEDIADLSEAFETLAGKGAAAYGGKTFMDLSRRLKAKGPEGVKMLVEALSGSAGAEARFLASGLLEQIGDPAALPALGKALAEDKDMLVRRSASHAVAVIGTDDALAPLRTAMGADEDWGVRVNSAYGVAKLGGEDGLKMLSDAYFSQDTPQEYLLAILGGLADVAAPSTAGTFRRILGDTEDPAYLMISMGALAKMKDTDSLAALQKIADSELAEAVRNTARRTIDAINAPPKPK